MLQGSHETTRVARRLRGEMSLPEVLLWGVLRERPNGLKFRRQHPSGPYVADFFCHEARLVVEIDGSAHDMGDCPDRDAERDRWFQKRGMQVLRIPAAEVLRDVTVAVAQILKRAGSSSPCSAWSPPRAEEHN